MSYSQREIDELVIGLDALIEKEKEVKKLEDELRVYGADILDKKFQMGSDDFLNVFDNFEVQDRQMEEYPYQLITKAGNYSIITLLTAKKFYQLLNDGIISKVEELAEIR